MKPRGLLMIEHRLIEKMIEVIRKEISKIKETNKVDIIFIDTAVDFIRIYADKTHHGKEEDILFCYCAEKNMSEKDKKAMNELIAEHKYGRKIVGELVDARDKYIRGSNTINIILEKLGKLAEFYPEHIKKEDKIFFPGSEKYFSRDELGKLLGEFREFDQAMIHEKYKLVVEQLKSRNC